MQLTLTLDMTAKQADVLTKLIVKCGGRAYLSDGLDGTISLADVAPWGVTVTTIDRDGVALQEGPTRKFVVD